MAKIKFGMMMTDARGKLGGQVFSKNRAGAYIRTKVSPSNPQTSYQTKVRSNLAMLSSGWNALTASQISQWNSAVDAWQSTDVFGDIKKPTGKNLFVKLNLNLWNSNQDPVNSPPSKMELPNFTTLSVGIDTTSNEFMVSGMPLFADGKFQIEACAPVANGVNYVKNKFRVISYERRTQPGDFDIADAYIAKFGNAPANANIFFRVRAIGANGQASAPLIVKAYYID